MGGSVGAAVNLGVKDLFRGTRYARKTPVRTLRAQGKGGGTASSPGVWFVQVTRPSPQALGVDRLWAMTDERGRAYEGQYIAERDGVFADIHYSDVGSACTTKLFQMLKQGKMPPRIVGVGLCGGVDPSLKLGDLVVASDARLLEPAASGRSMELSGSRARPDRRMMGRTLRAAKRQAGREGGRTYLGSIVTSRVDPEEEAGWVKGGEAAGIAGADMEAFDFLRRTSEKKYEVKAAVLLAVSNSLAMGEDLTSIAGNRAAVRRMRRGLVEAVNRAALDALFDAAD